jgi:chemotaxis protein methyltransferase CheR
MTSAATYEDDGVELDRLLEAIFQQYHYDFRHYVRTHMGRRVARAQVALQSPSITHLLDGILQDPATFSVLLRHLTVQVSDLFRDPSYYAVLREQVLPFVATYPHPRIWVAGCGTGEEAYSMAILLAEEALLERSLIYATDIDARSLEIGEAGAYDLDRVRGFSENYFRAGGRASLSDYYTAAYGKASFDLRLRRRIVFSDHCLATDSAFAEMQLVSCRNVLIYFDRKLQDRVTGLFRESLCHHGFLGLGSKETVAFSSHAPSFEPFDVHERLYRLKGSRP